MVCPYDTSLSSVSCQIVTSALCKTFILVSSMVPSLRRIINIFNSGGRNFTPELVFPVSSQTAKYENRYWCSRLRLKCDGTHAETRFRLSAKRTSPIKSAGASVQSITGSRGVGISCSNAGCTMFRGSVKGTGYAFHSSVSPSIPHPYFTVCHHISTGLYCSLLCPQYCILFKIIIWGMNCRHGVGGGTNRQAEQLEIGQSKNGGYRFTRISRHSYDK